MALNTHALRFVANRKMRVSLGSYARETCSIRGIDQFTFEAHVKVGAGSTSLAQKAYVETQDSRQKIRFSCAPTRDNGRSVLVFEFARTNSSPTTYRYELPNGWDDRWHHVAFSVTTGEAKYAIYFDDIKVKEGKIVGGGFDAFNRPLLVDKAIPKEIVIGACPKGSSGFTYWDGKIDNVRLYRASTASNTYSSQDRPIDDHCTKIGAFANDINLIEEWRFNEGPRGSQLGMTYGVVDHQYDPKLKADEYAETDSGNSAQNTEFTPGPAKIAEATLYEDGKVSNNLWIGMDVSENFPTTGITLLPKDADRPFLGDKLKDTTPPSMPTGLTTGAITEDSFEISWKPSIDDIAVQEYEVAVSTQATFDANLPTRKVNRRTTDLVSGLTPAQRYYWKVRAVDAEGNASPWASSTAYRPFKLKSTSRVNYSPNPSFEGTLRHLFAWDAVVVSGSRPNLSVANYSTTNLRPGGNSVYGDRYLAVQSNAGTSGIYRGAAHELSWQSGVGLTGSFWVRGSAEFGVYLYLMQDTKVITSTPLVNLQNLSTGSSAQIHILTSDWTRFTFTTTPEAAGMNKIKVLFVSTTGAEFNFDLDGIMIQRSDNVETAYFDGTKKSGGSADVYWAVFEPSSTSTLDGYLVDFTDESASVYDVEVYPAKLLQTLDFADRIAPNPPSTEGVSHAATADIGVTSFIAKWKAPQSNFEDIVAYELQVGLKSNLSSADVLFVPGYDSLRIYDAELNNGVYERLVGGLAPATTYYYRVAAIDSNGNRSAWSSNGQPITTEALVDTLPPTDVILDEPTNITFDGFTLNWREAIDDIKVLGYRVTVALDAEFEQIVGGYNNRDVGNVLSYEVFGLVPQTLYYCRVRAYDTQQSSLNAESISVETLERPEELGGFVGQRLQLESLVPISSAQPTTAYGESSILTLNDSTDALLQFTMNRTVPRGELVQALLNLTRLTTNNPHARYILREINNNGTATSALYTPSQVKYSTRPTETGVNVESSFSLFTSQKSSTDIVSLDLTTLLQKGSGYYGFRLEAQHEHAALSGTSGAMFAGVTKASSGNQFRASLVGFSDAIGKTPAPSEFFVTLGGTQNSEESRRPDLSFTVDTNNNTLISVARVKTNSQSLVTRNIFSNPTFDMTGSEFPIPNSSFELNDTRYWTVLPNDMIATFTKSEKSYDSRGGSGQLVVSQPSAASIIAGKLGAEILNEERIPASNGVEYRFRAFVSTSNSDVIPRLAIYRYGETGQLISREVDLSVWSPTANVWYQRQFNYTVSANDGATKFLQFGLVVQSYETGDFTSEKTIRIDAVTVTSSADTTPLYVEKIGSSTLNQVVGSSFDNGYDNSGVSLRVTTPATTGTGVRLVADIPSEEGWISESFGTSTVNLVENPSFEYQSLANVTPVGAQTTHSIVPVNGAIGTNALRIISSNSENGAVIKTVILPTYAATNVNKSFVASCWVKGSLTYTAQLKMVYLNGAVTSGQERTFTVTSTDWQRLTLSNTNPISVSDAALKNGSVLSYVELRITTSITNTAWFVDAVQIEERATASSAPTTYCDGDQLGSTWYGLPHRSISFRNAFVAAFKIKKESLSGEAQLTGDTNLKTVLKLTSQTMTPTSPEVILGVLPSTNEWTTVRTWPVAMLDDQSDNPPFRVDLEVYTTDTRSIAFLMDAVMITFGDSASTYFNGATIGADWRQAAFSSISEHTGIEILTRVHTRGNAFDKGNIRTWFRIEDEPSMGFVDDGDIRTSYVRDSRYVDVRIPPRIRWNELTNPSFELGVSGWKTVDSQGLSTKISSTAEAGGSVGVWTIGTITFSTSMLQSNTPVPAVAGQLWSFETSIRTPAITRGTTVKGRVGLAFLDANGAIISTTLPTSDDYYSTDANNIQTRHSTVFEVVRKSEWLRVGHSSVAPTGTRWVTAIVTNALVSAGAYGLISNEQIELDACMLYRGGLGRYYLDGDDNRNVYWEGKRHQSPSVFVVNGNQAYQLRFMADDGQGVLVGESVEQRVVTVPKSVDFVEFHFDQHRRNVTSRSIELVIPYTGTNQTKTTLSGVYRRSDMFDRIPLSVEFNEVKNEVYVRADDLAQNREYVFEIDVVTPDASKLRGENRYVTRVSSSVRDDRSNEISGDGLIQFDGFTLNGPGSTYYWVTEHDAFSLPERRMQIESIPRMDGGIELKPYWGIKKISMSGGVWGNTRAELYDNVNALRAALTGQRAKGERSKLRIDTLANNEDFYYATCSGFQTSEVAGESLRSLTWTATFDCADPFFYRGKSKISTFDILASKPINTVDRFYTEDQAFTIYNSGTVYTNPTLTLSVVRGGGDYSVAFINETTGQRLMPKAVLNRNDSLTATTKTQEVYKNQNIALDYVGSFITLQPGVNIIRTSIKDLKASRHNLLANPGVERGPAEFTNNDSDGIRQSYLPTGSNGQWQKPSVGGVRITRNRFQTLTNSDYAALVECDGLQEKQGVVFTTSNKLGLNRFAANSMQRRTFSAAAYVRADIANTRQVILDNCFIRIWYMDGTFEDQATQATTQYRLSTQWKLIQLPKITSQDKSIDYVEVLFLFRDRVGGAVSFYIDNAILTQDDLSADQVEAAFQLVVSHDERFI